MVSELLAPPIALDPGVIGTFATEEILRDHEPSRTKFLADIVSNIDHTALKQTTTDSDLDQLCSEALRCIDRLGVGPKSVCVNSGDVAYCADKLRGSGIAVCSVVGFPLGKMLTEAKVAETNAAISAGATEIDMVINLGALKSGRFEDVENDIKQVAETCHSRGVIVKAIIETCNLSDSEKIKACQLADSAGADFVKTSTGFEKSGATVADVALMRANVSKNIHVKASSGIKTPEDALTLRNAGADRFGASSLIKTILAEVSGEEIGAGSAKGNY